jgi:hypothetical protein
MNYKFRSCTIIPSAFALGTQISSGLMPKEGCGRRLQCLPQCSYDTRRCASRAQPTNPGSANHMFLPNTLARRMRKVGARAFRSIRMKRMVRELLMRTLAAFVSTHSVSK